MHMQFEWIILENNQYLFLYLTFLYLKDLPPNNVYPFRVTEPRNKLSTFHIWEKVKDTFSLS